MSFVLFGHYASAPLKYSRCVNLNMCTCVYLWLWNLKSRQICACLWISGLNLLKWYMGQEHSAQLTFISVKRGSCSIHNFWYFWACARASSTPITSLFHLQVSLNKLRSAVFFHSFFRSRVMTNIKMTATRWRKERVAC